jgi:alcohol dehydrogenase class IV
VTVIQWANRVLRVWWPLFVSAAALSFALTMGTIALTAVQERDDIARLLELRRREDSNRDRVLADAVDAVDERLRQRLADHDAEVQRQIEAALAAARELLERPAGTPPEPVTAKPAEENP